MTLLLFMEVSGIRLLPVACCLSPVALLPDVLLVNQSKYQHKQEKKKYF